jgi:hypothetical protein
MIFVTLLVAIIATYCYGCEYEAAHKKLFYFVEQSNVTLSGEVRARHAEEMTAFIEAHRFIKEDIVKVDRVDYIWVEKDGEIGVSEVKPRRLLELNSSYYTIYPSYPPKPKPLTTLAYACDLVTCDHRVVETLCKAGADPNFKNLAGLYPATCCLRGLIRFYETKDENKPFVDNQLKKFKILQTFEILYDHGHGGDRSLFLDDDIKQFLTEDTEKGLGDLLWKCTYSS